MPDIIETYVLDTLSELAVIAEKDGCQISMVRDSVDGTLFIKKNFTSGDIGIYKSLKNISHAALPQIHHVIALDSGFVVIEEYINGSTLQSAKPFSDVSNIAIQLCEALEVLHGMNPPIIHRDINPSNIMLTADGRVKLIDFDAAKEYKSATTEDTTTLGTRAYAAPEQFGYAKADARTDIYCLGATMYYLLNGEPYVKGGAFPPGKMGKIMRKCLQIDPAARYQTAAALRKDLTTGQPQYFGKIAIFALFAIMAAIFAVGIFVFLNNENEISPTPPTDFAGEIGEELQEEEDEVEEMATVEELEELEELEPLVEDFSVQNSINESDSPNWADQAARTAQMYLSIMPFSRESLINQLIFEGFTAEESAHGVDIINANWHEQAALAAQRYLEVMPFSRQALIDQLVFEGFTTEQAIYGVNSIGL
ncbi:MAG: Ltp family lipoprotein [Turicibacter sp.]|nr:Ltp family lipoprotein [Turicibacter sp.]